MEYFANSQEKNDLIPTNNQENLNMKNPKLNDDSPIINSKKNNSYETKRASMLEEVSKNNEDVQVSQSENTRKNSVKRKNRLKEVENNKDSSLVKKEGKRGSCPKKKKRKSSIRKGRKGNEVGGTIKVIGKISAKLESLIQRLEQNSANDKISETRIENKYQMAPKIKAALEKFNKKKEEESQKIPFKPSKFKVVKLPDSNKGNKYDPKLGKIRYMQEIIEDGYEDEEEEEDDYEEEEEEEDDDDSEGNNNDNKNYKSLGKVAPERLIKKEIKTNEKSNQEKEKRKKKDNKALKFSNENSFASGDDSDKDKSLKKKKKRKLKKENNFKIPSDEEYEESESENNRKAEKNKKKKNKKKNSTFNFSEIEKSEKKMIETNEDEVIKKKLKNHKSGKGIEVTKLKDGSYSISSLSSKDSNQANKKNKRSSSYKGNIKLSKDNPINIIGQNKKSLDDKNGLVIRKKPVKGVLYNKFAFNHYTIKNYNSKPFSVWKEQIKKYVPSKQINFSVFAKINKRSKSKKMVMFNVNNNNSLNKKKNNNNKYGIRKSVAVSFNDSSFLNFAKKYDISKYEEKLSDIKKKKVSIRNEKKSINTEFEKRRKRYQSILLPNDKTFNDFANKFNKNKENKLSFNKITDPKKKRMSVYQILQKRGLNQNFPDVLNSGSNEDQNNEKLRSNNKKGINARTSKDKGTKLEEIPEKDEDVIKETHFGVKYIVFKTKNELKTIYKKEKWNLSISKITSIFLKAIRPNEVKNKINAKNVHNNIKNNSDFEKISKNNYDKDSNKMQNISLNSNVDKKSENKLSDISYEDNENSSGNQNSNRKNLINKFNETVKKKSELKKIYKKEDKKPTSNEQLFKNFDSGTHYDKETKKSDKVEIKIEKSDKIISESNNVNDDANNLNNNKFKRTNKKNLTARVRNINTINDLFLEEKEKKIGKVKAKKAKIKKFKSHKDEPEIIDDERRRKGNLYDYYNNKTPSKRNEFLKYENEKENTFNPKNIKK